VAPRETFNGLEVCRQTGFDFEEAIRWGHFFLGHRQQRRRI